MNDITLTITRENGPASTIIATSLASTPAATIEVDGLSGTIPTLQQVTDAGANTTDSITVGTLSATGGIFSGTVTATAFSGVGTNLTALNASNLSSGTVSTAKLGSGTASSTTYLRGDQTWAALPATVIPTLQQVTDAGATTTDSLTLNGTVTASGGMLLTGPKMASVLPWYQHDDTGAEVLRFCADGDDPASTFAGIRLRPPTGTGEDLEIFAGRLYLSAYAIYCSSSQPIALSGLLGNNTSPDQYGNVRSLFLQAHNGSLRTDIQNIDVLTWSASNPIVITPYDASTVGLNVRANSVQTANLQEWSDASGNVLSSVGPDGSVDINDGAIHLDADGSVSGLNSLSFNTGGSISDDGAGGSRATGLAVLGDDGNWYRLGVDSSGNVYSTFFNP